MTAAATGIELDRIREVDPADRGAQLLVFQPLCTAIGMAALVITGNMPEHRLGSTAAAWYSANLYAEFLTAPTALAWLRWPRPAASQEIGVRWSSALPRFSSRSLSAP